MTLIKKTFFLLFAADGAGSDVDTSNITDLLNEPGEFNVQTVFKAQKARSSFFRSSHCYQSWSFEWYNFKLQFGDTIKKYISGSF